MALFTISDPHLSFGTDKPMDIFGRNWENHAERIRENWTRLVGKDDTVVIPGDISWAMGLANAEEDLRFLHNLPGRKLIGKGNHDYWWDTLTKMNRFCEEKGFDTINFLFNNAYFSDGKIICGTRGWIDEIGVKKDDEKIIKREAQRLEMSLAEGEKLKELYPDAELFLLIGYDSLKGFLNWKKVDYILSEVSLAVADRGGCDFLKQKTIFKNATGRDFFAIENPGTVSSTYVRELLKLGIYSQEFISQENCDYIKQNNLYAPDDFYLKVQARLKYGRLFHTAGVVATATSYAKATGESVEKARIASLLHDIAKYERAEDYSECGIPADAPESVKHQYLGAYIAKKEFKIEDEDILNAIRYHTTGRPEMSLLEKIVFTADLLDPSRSYDEVDELRLAVEKDFEAGFKRCVERLIEHLKNSASDIFYLTTLTNEYYNKKS